jgi:hypothetical protein
VIFRPATRAFGSRRRFADSMPATHGLPSPSGRRWREAPDEGARLSTG